MFKKEKLFKIKIIAGLFIAITIGVISYVYIPNIFQKQQTISSYRFSRQDNRPDVIKGTIVTLKRLQPSYFENYMKMINYPEVVKPLFFKEKLNYVWLKKYLQEELEREAVSKTFSYIIFDNKDQKLVGSIEIRNYDPRDNGQFGVWLSPKYWGGGRLQEAFKLISKTYFKIKNENKFIAHVEMWNLRSYYALKKCGFKLIDTLHFDNRPSRYLLEFKNPYKK